MTEKAGAEANVWRVLYLLLGGGILLAHLGIWWAARSRWTLLWPPSPALRWSLLTLALLGVSWALYRMGRHGLGLVLMQLMILDLAFGFATRWLETRGLVQSFFPSFRAGRSFDFEYHPLLQGRPRPNTAGTFLMFGHRVDWQHDSHGYRRSRPVDPGKPTVAVIGGSTTYDTGNSNATMWTHVLEEQNPGLQFLNLGVPGYTSAEHVLQTAFYLPALPRADCAIYYVGWNDIRNSHLPDLDPGFADYQLRIQPGLLGLRNSWEPGSPILTLVGNMVANWFSWVPQAPRYPPTLAKPGVDQRLAKYYERNLETIATLNRARGQRFAYVAQVLNFEVMKSDRPVPSMPLVPEKDTQTVMTVFNAILRAVAERHQVPFISPDQTQFHAADFADNGHFNIAGARKFAALVQQPVLQACSLNSR